MNLGIALLLFGLLLGQAAHAGEKENRRPRWVIMATIIDLTTNHRVAQSQLEGRALEFDTPDQCMSIVARVHTVADHNLATVLTCRKVESKDIEL